MLDTATDVRYRVKMLGHRNLEMTVASLVSGGQGTGDPYEY
jgi:hypothetical protein